MKKNHRVDTCGYIEEVHKNPAQTLVFKYHFGSFKRIMDCTDTFFISFMSEKLYQSYVDKEDYFPISSF